MVVWGAGLPAAHATPADCATSDPRTPDYQRRSEMDRCEGLRRNRDIAADGLQLVSYTIGQLHTQRGPRGGEVFRLRVPVAPAGWPAPVMSVQAKKDNTIHYLMRPLRLTDPQGGWRFFYWGAGVMEGQAIPRERLRAAAAIHPPGDEDQWLPVWFSPDSSYTLVIRSNASLPVASVRIVDADNRTKETCLRNSRIEQDFPCIWRAKTLPAGTYRLIVRAADGATVLNTSLRHDPRWLN